jgi:hypothetical protein
MINEEAVKQSKAYKASLMAWYKTDIFCRKSGRNAKLAVKKHQLQQAKKSFGVDYLTLLEQDAGFEKLDECLRDGHMKVGMIKKDIQALRAEKTSLDELLKQKVASLDMAENNHSQTEVHETGKVDEFADVYQQQVQKKDEATYSELTGKQEVCTNTEDQEAKPVTIPSETTNHGDEEDDEDKEQEYVVLGPRKLSELD